MRAAQRPSNYFLFLGLFCTIRTPCSPLPRRREFRASLSLWYSRAASSVPPMMPSTVMAPTVLSEVWPSADPFQASSTTLTLLRRRTCRRRALWLPSSPHGQRCSEPTVPFSTGWNSMVAANVAEVGMWFNYGVRRMCRATPVLLYTLDGHSTVLVFLDCACNLGIPLCISAHGAGGKGARDHHKSAHIEGIWCSKCLQIRVVGTAMLPMPQPANSIIRAV